MENILQILYPDYFVEIRKLVLISRISLMLPMMAKFWL